MFAETFLCFVPNLYVQLTGISWHVYGAVSRLAFCYPEKDGVCIETPVGEQRFRFTEDLADVQTAILSGTVDQAFVFICLVRSDDTALCFPACNMPFLGFYEQSFESSGEISNAVQVLSDVWPKVEAAVPHFGKRCVAFAACLVMSQAFSDEFGPLLWALSDVSLAYPSYVSGFADIMRRIGLRPCTEFMPRLGVSRLFELLSFGYTLVVPIRKGAPFEVSQEEIFALPENHVCTLCMDSNGVVWLFDSMGMRTVTLEDIAAWSGSDSQVDDDSLSWYDSRIVIGARL